MNCSSLDCKSKILYLNENLLRWGMVQIWVFKSLEEILFKNFNLIKSIKLVYMIHFMKIKMNNRLAKIVLLFSQNVFILDAKIQWLLVANQIYLISLITNMKILNLLVYIQHKKLINLSNYSAMIQVKGIF